MRVVLSFLTLSFLFIHGPANGQGEAVAIKALQKVFRTAKGSTPDTKGRLAALEAITKYDSEKVAKALVKVFISINREVDALDAERSAKGEELRRLLKGQEFKARKVLPQGQMGNYRQLKADLAEQRGLVDARRSTLSRAGQIISEKRNPEAVNWLIKTISGSKKYPLYLKVKVAQAAGGTGAPALPAMLTAVKKAKLPEEVASLLDGIGLMGKEAGNASTIVIGLLKSKSSIVREHAALALSTICDPKAIEPMISLLSRSYGQSKKRIGAYLEALTRQKHGASAATWKRWFAAEGARYLSGSAQLGDGAPSSRKKTTENNYYFGIPQDGKSIVYIIDASGSMSAKVKLHIPKSNPGRDGRTVAKMEKKPSDKADDEGMTTRLEACKAELIRALGLLDPKTKFNVIWYSELPYQFKPGMMLAKSRSIKAAQDWVRKLQPSGSTNIHDSMQMGFQLTGQIPGLGGAQKGPITGNKKLREAAPDTIFLLSDGSPTLPTGGADSTEKIIAAVRKWNSLKTVVVHCIGIGQGVNIRFMRQLATENGGEFKKF
jgi:Mg-chelatase subunit ChlD